MKFTIENVGPIKEAGMELGDLTILCGRNNTGKTYITYNTFNFLDAIRHFVRVELKREYSEELLEKGKVVIDLFSFLEDYPFFFKKTMDKWVKEEAARQMATRSDYYANATMNLDFSKEGIKKFLLEIGDERQAKITRTCTLHAQKEAGDGKVTFIIENDGYDLPDVDVIHKKLTGLISGLFCLYFPEPFIITCERTGVACFRPSFIFSQPKDNADISRNDYDEDAPRYPRPMQKDWRFVMEFKEASIEKSYIAEEHPEILEYFEELCGGRYSLNEDIVLFEPHNDSKVKLTTTECSSSVRSLMELNFYLKHMAKRHHVLMVDEPELNLHPENQRKMARLIAMIVNAGIKVFITTHSDYIIREFNTLIMLNAPRNKRLKAIAEELGYDRKHGSCLLAPSSVRCYVVKDGTTKPMDVSPKYGIEVTSFDDTINDVNALQRRILFGG